MNKIILIGNVTKDAELKYLPGGDKAVLKFSIAVARGYKREDGTDFVNCTLWGKRAESLAAYVIKGTSVAIDGALRINKKEDKTFVEVILNDLKLLSKGKSEETNNEPIFTEPSYDTDMPW